MACAPRGGTVTGPARVVRSVDDFLACCTGDVLIVGDFPTSVVAQLRERGVRPSAVISQAGGIGCHAAIECRENQWPCAVGVRGALKMGIENGWIVTYRVDADRAYILAEPGAGR